MDDDFDDEIFVLFNIFRVVSVLVINIKELYIGKVFFLCSSRLF